MSKQEVLSSMCRSGLLPVFRTKDARNLFAASRAFYDAGITCVEYTMSMPNVLDRLAEGAAQLPNDLYLGLGTVIDAVTVDKAVAAGARFIATPGLSAEVVEACKRHEVVCVAGIMTPTEIMEALQLGADVLKVFPAASVGPEFFIDVLGPFPGLHLMAASKTALEELDRFVPAGAEIVTFLGESLDPVAYASGDFTTLTQTAKKYAVAIQTARKAR
jgi:2-dehydro-3-deoxyphosphogluconate aldolase / (4S)-4-hydroxy-2-oxoglutarate aldolase